MQSYNPTDRAYVPSKMQASITQMIVDGTQGTAAGPGLVQAFNDARDTACSTKGNPYAVARCYNSGSVNAANLSNAKIGSAAYTSNIANYLLGWNGWGNGPAGCGF